MPVHSSGGTRFGKASPPSSIGRLAPYNPGQVCHRSRKAFKSSAPSRLRREPSGTPCQGKASLSHTPCKSKAGHKRSFSAHSHCGGRCLARFSFVGTAVALANAPLRPRRRAAPRSARSLAPSTPTRLHARVSQAASRPCVSLLVALSPLSSASAFQGTRSHFRLAQNACAVAPSPRPVKPRPTRAPSALPRLPLVSRWSPVGRLPLLALLTTWGFQQAPSGHCFTRRVSRPRCFFPPSFLRRSKLKACKLKASYQQVKSLLSHSPRPRPGEGARSSCVILYAYPG